MTRLNYGSNIPRARKMLMGIAARIGGSDPATSEEILHIVDTMMTRSKPMRRAPVAHGRLSNWQRARALELLRTTDMHVSDIAIEVGTNPGRISELQQGLI